MIRAIALGSMLASFIACAGGARYATAPVAPRAAGPDAMASPLGDDPHAQITALEHDITSRGGTFTPMTEMGGPAMPMTEQPRSTDAACHPAPTQTCGDSCKLSDAICDDAKKICDIAGQLANDAWAAGKCESGKTSCTESHKTCCSCT